MAHTNRQWRLKRRPVGEIQPGDLELVNAPLPDLADGQVLIRNHYLSLDPTNRIWMSDMDQYMPPVEIGAVMRGGVIGVVEESRAPQVEVGALVTPGVGGWQDYEIVPARLAQKLPNVPGLSPTAFMSVAGLTGVTAYFGMLDIGQPKAGETVVVSAAAGAVGSVAGQLAKMQGARVVGIAGSADKCRWVVEDLGFDACINYRTEDVPDRLAALCPRGVDVNFENVGGPIMNAVMARMNNFSRMPLCGLISSYNDASAPTGPSNFAAILMHRITVRGFIVSDFMDRWAEAVGRLAGWAAEGRIKWKVHIENGLEVAPEAVKRLFTGAHDGKLLVRIAPDAA